MIKYLHWRHLAESIRFFSSEGFFRAAWSRRSSDLCHLAESGQEIKTEWKTLAIGSWPGG